MRRKRINWLYYITHINNVPSILERGIFSHARIERDGIPFTPIYNAEIVANRHSIKTPDGRTLWDFANLYFQPRNPMLYRVKCVQPVKNIAVLAVHPAVLNGPDIFISTGNAAHSLSTILPHDQGIKNLAKIIKATDIEFWKGVDGSKRKIMAECLVPEFIPPGHIGTIYVPDHEARDKINEILKRTDVEVIPEPNIFFQPSRQIPLESTNITLAEGDMFFARAQTLTVSVNCVGIMGKGLASRAKYQFPDVYVVYQDACRRRQLQMGKPFLYKREPSFDYELADEPDSLTNANASTWFLLFATKRHWRDRSDIQAIESGLQWIQQNYRSEGVTSLAVPALGCGLGRLEWRDVGPLLCKVLSSLEIPVWIYLPAEKKVSEELLSKKFLLG